MKTRFYIVCVLMLIGFVSQSQPVQVIIGTGTTSNSTTSYPAPYGNYYWGARHQFIIRATEITAAGITGSRIISELGFNVRTPIAGGLIDFQIKMKNTSTSAFPTSGYAFESGTNTVFGPSNIAVVSGWNMHQFHTSFLWDGTSNILVEVCFNNNSLSTNALTYYTSTGFGSTIYFRQDATGVCAKTANTRTTNRPNMKLGMSLPLPPVASFTVVDTAYLNLPVNITNTSAHTMRSYWRMDTTAQNTLCNTLGCFFDTASFNLTYNFTTQGLYKITLYTRGYTGQVDSAIRYVYADTIKQKPKANFYASARNIGIFDIVNFYDSSLYGASAWEWSINPPCVTCGQFANVFTPNLVSKNVQLNTFDPGVYDICLKVWNDKGYDSVCKEKYLTILPSYFMCNGADSLSKESYGLVTDLGGTTNNYTIGLVGQCASGFVINPAQCSDTVHLYIDQFRLRTNDTLEFRNGPTLSSPLLAKYAGGNLSASQKYLKASAGTVFLRFKVGTGVSSAGDSGFAIRWFTSRSANIIANKNSFCKDDSLLLRCNKKTGRTYEWMYGTSTVSTDTFVFAKNEGDYQLTVTGAGCTDENNIALTEQVRPEADQTTTTPLLQCLVGNQFNFINKSSVSKGNYTHTWRIGDSITQQADTIHHSFKKSGVYTLAHIAVSDSGCTDTAYTYMRVLGKPDVSIVASTEPLCANDSVIATASSTENGSFEWYNNQNKIADGTSIYAKPQTAYTVKIINNYGCDSVSAPLLISQRPSPIKPVITRSGVHLVTQSNATSFRWFLNGSIISGATQSSYIPTQNGIYTVIADSNGCSEWSSPFVFANTASNEVEKAAYDLKVYPNPAQNMITLEAPDKFNWTITTISGREIIHGKSYLKQEVDLHHLAEGIYVVILSNQNYSKHFRLLKK